MTSQEASQTDSQSNEPPILPIPLTDQTPPQKNPQAASAQAEAQILPQSSVQQPPLKPTQQFQFERLMMKGELVQLRPFHLDIANRRCWKDSDDFKEVFVKLFIHELFCLRKWRRRDRELGRKLIKTVPDIVNEPHRYREHLAVAHKWVAAAKQNVEAWEEGETKAAALEGIDLHEDWLQALENQMNGGAEELK